MFRVLRAIALIDTLRLAACVVPPPTGPSVMAMPARGKTFEEFQHDDAAWVFWMIWGGASAVD